MWPPLPCEIAPRDKVMQVHCEGKEPADRSVVISMFSKLITHVSLVLGITICRMPHFWQCSRSGALLHYVRFTTFLQLSSAGRLRAPLDTRLLKGRPLRPPPLTPQM